MPVPDDLPDLGDPTLDTLRQRAIAKLKAKRKANEARYSLHPWPFLSEVVFTVNQVAESASIAPLLSDAQSLKDPHPDCVCGGCDNYLHHVVNQWFTHRLFADPKSRRMRLTWVMCGCHYWIARYRPNAAVYVGARKLGKTDSDGAAELVRRMYKIHENLPPEVDQLEANYQFGRIRFTHNNSEILAFAEGADQLRQFTATAILADEFAFWEKTRETYAAFMPTIEGGGRVTLISTANPGLFKQLVTDTYKG